MTGKSEPHSIRCLRAVEAYVGGRGELAQKLSISKSTVARWCRVRQIARKRVLDLRRLSDEKFTTDELLGAGD